MRHVSMHESFDGFFAPLQAAAAGAQCIVSSSGGNVGRPCLGVRVRFFRAVFAQFNNAPF